MRYQSLLILIVIAGITGAFIDALIKAKRVNRIALELRRARADAAEWRDHVDCWRQHYMRRVSERDRLNLTVEALTKVAEAAHAEWASWLTHSMTWTPTQRALFAAIAEFYDGRKQPWPNRKQETS